MNSKNIQKSDYEVMLREERDIESNTPIKVSKYKLGLIFFIEISVKLWIHAAHRKKILVHVSKVMKHIHILEHAIFKFATYVNISNQNFVEHFSLQSKFFWVRPRKFFKPDFRLNAWAKILFWLRIRNRRKIWRDIYLHMIHFEFAHVFQRSRICGGVKIYYRKKKWVNSLWIYMKIYITRKFALIPNLKSK